MPNPRAQRQLTLDRVVSDLKSFAEPAQAMGDMMAGALRGSVAGTAGAAGDISDISRTLAPDTMQTVFGRRVMPTTEEMNKMLPPAVPQNASPSRKHTAETFGSLGEFMPTPMAGTAAKALTYGLGRGAGALTRGAGKMVNDAMVYNQGPLAQGSLSFLAPRTATMNVVKPEGGNWLGGNMTGSTVGNVDRSLNRFKTETVAGQTPAERIPLHERALQDPAINDDGRAIIQRHLDITKGEAAVDKWIENNIGNYVKKQMATPSDPVRLMLERRSQEIEAQFQVDMNRAERTRARAEAEPDPRRQANLMRQAAQQEEQAKFDRDFATQNASHLSPEQQPWGDIDTQAVTELKGKRKQAGFSPEGEAKSDLARRWEQLSDEAVGINRAGDVQAQKDALTKAQDAERAFLNKDDEVNETFRDRLRERLAQRGESLSDKDLDALVKNLPTSQKAVIIGEGETWDALRNETLQTSANVNSGLWGAYSENKWIDKLNPETNVYSAYIGDLGFDHVIDVIRQDVAAGRIRPEQLNKLSMDQAIQRTAEFNAEQAKKMQETAIKNTEGMPVHKEYPEEGYKWIELAPSKEKKVYTAETLPQGYTLEKNNDGFYTVHNWNVGETPTTDSYSKNPEESIAKFNKWINGKQKDIELEKALKYEGDTMGHCVGGYCPDVLEGRSRIYSLRDKRGEPHVTVEVRPKKEHPYHDQIPKDVEQQLRIEGEKIGNQKADEAGFSKWGDDRDLEIKQAISRVKDDWAMNNPIVTNFIAQIKGKQNQAPKEQYLPYVQDFVRSGEWEDVGDLRNTGLVKAGKKYATEKELSALASRYYPEHPDMTPANVIMHYERMKGMPEFQDETTKKFIEDFEAGNYMPPEAGMKKGGKVSISDNCDCQHMAVMDKHMAGGGALSKAAIEALERMKALKPEFQARVNLQNKYKAETVGLPYNEVKPLQMTNEQIREEMDRMAKSQKLVNTIKSGEQMLNHIVATDPAKEALKNDKMTNYIKSRKFSEKTIDPSKLPSIDDIYAIENDLYGRVLMPDEYKVKDYKDRIKAGSMPPAIVMDEFGNILDGQHRAIAAREANVPIKAYVPEQSKAKGGAVEKLIKLARAPAKTKAEIEAIAQRIAPQMTGEYVRASDKTAKTVAGKTQKQFEREKTLEHDIRPTDGERPLPKDVDIENLKGNVMMGIAGDPTITGQTIYSVAGRPLRSPAPQHGGPLYGLGKEDEFWASNLGAAQGVQNRAKGLSELYESPVVGNYVMMGPDSYSYAQHFADTNLQNIRPELMTKKQIEGFNKLVRQGSLKSGPRPSFPGIENPEETYLHFAVDPELRKHFGNLMQMPTVTEKFGLPSGQDVAHAVTEPDLRNLEIGVTGKSLGLMKPDVTDLKLSSHPTYSHDIPGQFLGGMKYPVPHDLMFPDTLKSVRENPAQAPQEFGSFKMVGPRQVIDQQMIDEIKQYQDMIKKYTGKKKGGKVKKMAEGGEITGDDLILEERPL